MKKIVVIPPTGDIETIEVPEGEIPYETLTKAVGGYLEFVGTKNVNVIGLCAYIDEEGKLKRLPVNHRATSISAIDGYDYICGNMVVFKAEGENSLGLTEDEVECLLSAFE